MHNANTLDYLVPAYGLNSQWEKENINHINQKSVSKVKFFTMTGKQSLPLPSFVC